MCGLIGVASTEARKNFQARQSMLKAGLIHSVERGDHSTGIAGVLKGKENKPPFIYKRALASPDFVQLKQVEKFINNLDDYSMVIGHTRAATFNVIEDSCAHPFMYDHITLAHNGHVQNANRLIPTGQTCHIPVDSAQLAMAMSLRPEKDVLEEAEGAFALTWHNSKDGTLNFARNEGRPLRFAFVEDENTMYWASERLMLVWLADRFGVKWDGKFFSLDPGDWIVFDPKDYRKFEVRSFNPRLRATGQPVGRTNTIPPATVSGDTTAKTSNEVAVSLPRKTWSAYIERVLQTITINPVMEAARMKNYQVSSGRPGKARRVDHVKKQVKDLGYVYEEPVLFTPQTFSPYKNQQDMLGTVRGVLQNTAQLAEITHIKYECFKDMLERKNVLATVIGVTETKPRKLDTLLLERHVKYMEFTQASERFRDYLKSRQQQPTGPLIQQVLPGIVGLITTIGPDGVEVSNKRFLELVEDGCYLCADNIPMVGSGKLRWHKEQPICQSCQGDPRQLILLNEEASRPRTSH